MLMLLPTKSEEETQEKIRRIMQKQRPQKFIFQQVEKNKNFIKLSNHNLSEN